MSSRFFATGSDSESESSSESEEQTVVQAKSTVTTKVFAFSDDEEETKRVVRSAKDKRFEELQNVIKQLRNHKKIKDISKVLETFEDLTKALQKSQKVIEKEGGVPRFYIRALVELEDFINETWEDREGRKKLNKVNSKALTTMRQKLRKYNRDFEAKIASYRENPDVGDEQEAPEDDRDKSDSESDDDDEAVQKKKSAVPADAAPDMKSQFLKGGDSEGSDDSDLDWPSDSDSESSDSSEPEGGYTNMAAKFLKKTTAAEEAAKAARKQEKKERKAREQRREEEERELEEGEWTEVQRGAPMAMEKPKMFAKGTEINHAVVLKKLNEILAARGKKGTDRSEQIMLLGELRRISEENNLGLGMTVKILFNIVASIFDYNPNIATCMKDEMWAKCITYITETMDILIDNTNIFVGANVLEESEAIEAEPFRVRGCILSVMERADEEFIKMLQACDAHSTEYVERLKDEKKIEVLVVRLQKYLEERGTSQEICRVYLRRIEHVYYKYDYEHYKTADLIRKTVEQKEEEAKDGEVEAKDGKVERKDEEVEGKDGEVEGKDGEVTPQEKGGEEAKDMVEEQKQKEKTAVIMDKLCKYIYAKDTTDRIRTRAILCHIYHHALHGRWYEARDLMLMSHLQDTIQHSDVPTQILYNRTMVQLGLCAFRYGNIKDAHNALLDIQSGGRAKELLAQGLLMQRNVERDPEREKIEKRRQMPFHMHINLELLECVYLVSAMLLEIPYMAAHEFDARRRMISKSFHHQLRVSERQPLVGPPESMREHVVAASKAMKIGDWRACRDFIINEKMNGKVWDLFPEAEKVRDLISRKIQEESLRTYLFTYSAIYDSLCLVTLAEMFELDGPVVHSIISKMIINEELAASWDEPTQTVVMHRSEPTRLQNLALQLSDKLANLVDNNERILEVKQGTSAFYTRQGEGRFGRQGKERHHQGKERHQGQSGYHQQQGRGYQGQRRDRGDRDRDHNKGYQNKGYNRW
ncbi:EIF3C [Branchiostoma lanceolatum]|uniref:Eukaryotic translation initiation factor 3 subunit C n=1 Tax=Branchiostoma lanceolatum TaxID=7740 RepID=A0A8J9VNA4_BRALA|nr:EIF3C [Branchiostoma lanceolatum]